MNYDSVYYLYILLLSFFEPDMNDIESFPPLAASNALLAHIPCTLILL